jgi:hypothetical protein
MAMAAPPRRVKVAFEDFRLVVPVGPCDAETTVAELVRRVSARLVEHGARDEKSFAREAGDDNAPAPRLRLARLETADGFVLNGKDRIVDVIVENEQLVAVGYAAWLASELPHCSNSALDLVKIDFADDGELPKFVSVGVSDRNRLFVVWGTGYGRNARSSSVLRLEVLDPEALHPDLLRSGEIGRVGGLASNGQPWEAKASFVVHKSAPAAIELEVKTAAALSPTIKRVEFSVRDGIVETGNVVIVEDPDHRPLPRDLSLPTPEAEGPVIAAFDDATVNVEDTRVPPKEGQNRAKGDVDAVTITQRHDCLTELLQDFSSSDNTIRNYICCNLLVDNNSSEDVLFTDVTASYLASGTPEDGAWIEGIPSNDTVSTKLGRRSSYHFYRWDQQRRFEVSQSDSQNIAVGLEVKIPLSETVHIDEEERRIHRTLPNPMLVRLKFTTSAGKTLVLDIQAENPPLALPTPETRQKRKEDQDLTKFVWCDDVDTQQRSFVEVFYGPKDHEFLEVHVSGTNYHSHLRSHDLMKLEYRARVENLEAVLLDDISRSAPKNIEQKGETWAKVFGLIDRESGRCFALKIDIRTNTSRCVDYFPIPTDLEPGTY